MPLTPEQKAKRDENLAKFTSPDFLTQTLQGITSAASSIGQAVSEGKIRKAQTKATLADIKAGGSLTSPKEAPKEDKTVVIVDDKILGMSKPVFFGGLGLLVVAAGVGIFLVMRSGSNTPAK